MQIAELRYFLAVLEAGSFGRAAKTLRLQASTLSRAVSRLEDKLGVTLVERGPTGVKATPAGRLAFRHARHVVREAVALTEILDRSGKAKYCQIRTGFYLSPINASMMALLYEWQGAYPRIAVMPYETGEDTLHVALQNDRLDVVLVPDFLMRSYEIGLPIYSERLIAALPARHRLAGKLALNWSDFENEVVLLRAETMEGGCREFLAARIPGAHLHALNASYLSILAFVSAGYGVTITAEAYARLNTTGLNFIPINEKDAHFDVNLAWRPGSEDPVVGKFVAFMRDGAKQMQRASPSRAAFGTPDPPP